MQIQSWTQELQTKFPSQKKQRWYSLVSTDKPIYKPGDTIYYRVAILDAFTHVPITAAELAASNCTLNVEDGQKTSVHTSVVSKQENICHGSWKTAESQTGGDFTLKFTHTLAQILPGERKINIRSFRNPKLKSNIEFSKQGYTAGEEVSVVATIEKAEGGKFSKATTLVYVARVDEVEVFRSAPQSFLNAELGTSEMKFKLPSSIATGDGTLTIIVQESGATETASKTIPIVLQTVSMTLYPESGDVLLSNTPTTVYFEARSPISKEPMDVSGDLVDVKTGTVVATLKTQHEGRGKFSFTPSMSAQYEVRITQPTGVKRVQFTNPTDIEKPLPSFPSVSSSGFTISAAQTVVQQGATFPIVVHQSASTASSDLKLRIFKKEKLNQEIAVHFKERSLSASVDVKVEDVDGVITATLMNGTQPVAERLLFVKSAHSSINVLVESKQKAFVPQESAELVVTTTDSTGAPVDATLGLAVTDDSVLQMVEKRLQAPRLEKMYFFEAEVDHLEDAQVYLNSVSSSRADEAVDLLMGTQGWRRFIYTKSESEVFKSDKQAKFSKVIACTNALLEKIRSDDMPVRKLENVRLRRAMPVAECMIQRSPAPMMFSRVSSVSSAAPPSLPSASLSKAIPSSPVRQHASVSKPAAKKVEKTEQDVIRTNFVDTIFWNPYLKTKDGKAVVNFKLNDSITSFRAVVDAFTDKGGLGSSQDFVIRSSKAFFIDVTLPTRCIVGDELEVPVVITNNSLKKLAGDLEFTVSIGEEEITGSVKFSVEAESKAVSYIPFKVDKTFLDQQVMVSIAAKADVQGGVTFPFKDFVSRKLVVDAQGIPESIFFSDRIASRKFTEFPFTIPQDVNTNAPVEFSFQVFPSSTSNVLKAIESLIRAPYGCFEQTSSVVYPMVMARRYFKQHIDEVDPSLVKKADEHLEAGYKRLTGYECKAGGYEWFGSEPAHEALTAYGVLEFTDMCDIYPVDRAMLERTTKWLLSRSAATGEFERNSRALDSFGGAPSHITNGYIVWSLTNAGIPESTLSKNIEWLVKELPNYSDDAYYIGLVAGTLMNVGRTAEASKLADKLVSIQQATGSVENAKTTITRSQGKSLVIETTSISILTWLKCGAKNNPYVANIEKAIQWLSTQCSNGSFGSTQGTVLALKALLSYETEQLKNCTIIATVDGSKIADVKLEAQKPGDAVEMKPQLKLGAGDHKLSITALAEGSGSALCAATISYRSNKVSNSDAEKQTEIQFSASLAHSTLKQGEPTEIKVSVTNTNQKEDKAMTVAIVGVPSGLDVRVEKLQELVKAQKIAAYELKEKNVVLYWRGLAPAEKKVILLDAVATVPGNYTGASSCGYLYYFAEHKIWQQGLQCSVTKQ